MEIRETLEVSAMALQCSTATGMCLARQCSAGRHVPGTSMLQLAGMCMALQCSAVGMCLSEQVPIPDLSDCLDHCPRKETGRGFTEFRRLDHCPEKDLWMLHKQVTPQDVTDTTKMSQTCGYVGNEKLSSRTLVAAGRPWEPKFSQRPKTPHVMASRSGPLSLLDRFLT